VATAFVAAFTNALLSPSSTSHFSACVYPATKWSHEVGFLPVASATAASTSAGGFIQPILAADPHGRKLQLSTPSYRVIQWSAPNGHGVSSINLLTP
jgi:hypothetical protein